MKNLLAIVFLMFSCVFNSNAQFIDNVFAGGTVGFANPVGDFSEFANGGFTFNVFVGYHINEEIGIGFEYGSTSTVAVDTASVGGLNVNIYGLSSYLLKGYYKFTDGLIKPYLALGLGVATVREPDFIEKGAKRNGFGGSAEFGVNVKGFTGSYSFNLSGKSPKESVFNNATGDLPVNFHRFAVGYIYNF